MDLDPPGLSNPPENSALPKVSDRPFALHEPLKEENFPDLRRTPPRYGCWDTKSHRRLRQMTVTRSFDPYQTKNQYVVYKARMMAHKLSELRGQKISPEEVLFELQMFLHGCRQELWTQTLEDHLISLHEEHKNKYEEISGGLQPLLDVGEIITLEEIYCKLQAISIREKTKPLWNKYMNESMQVVIRLLDQEHGTEETITNAMRKRLRMYFPDKLDKMSEKDVLQKLRALRPKPQPAQQPGEPAPEL